MVGSTGWHFIPSSRTYSSGSAVMVRSVGGTSISGLPRRHYRARDDIFDVAFSSDGHQLASSSNEGTAQLWDVQQRRHLRTLAGHRHFVNSAQFTSGDRKLILAGPAFTPGGNTLVVAGSDSTVTVWDLRGSGFLHTDYVTAVDPTSDGRLMAAGGREQVIRLWDVPGHRLIGELDAIVHGQVTGLAFNKQGTILASAGLGYVVWIWDIERKSLIGQLGDGSYGSMMDVAFSPDGRLLATADYGGATRIWDVESRRETRVLWGEQFRSRRSLSATAALWSPLTTPRREHGTCTLAGRSPSSVDIPTH